MKNNNCPFRNMCRDHIASHCDECKAYKKIVQQRNKVKDLESEILQLRTRLQNAIEPCKVGDTVYCIKKNYWIKQDKIKEFYMQSDYMLGVKTSDGEIWTLGINCFTDKAKAEKKTQRDKGCR